MQLKPRQGLALAICFFWSLSLLGEETQEAAIWELLEGQIQARGTFEQTLVDEQAQVVERSSGRYAILRPRFFRWSITEPDRQEIVLKAGELWHYDVDLASATVRPAKSDGMFTPLELLGGDTTMLKARFNVEQLDENSYRLTPNFPQAGFTAVDVSWHDQHIRSMRILDRSGQQIQLSLTPDETAGTLMPEDFDLVLPDDVELHNAL